MTYLTEAEEAAQARYRKRLSETDKGPVNALPDIIEAAEPFVRADERAKLEAELLSEATRERLVELLRDEGWTYLTPNSTRNVIDMVARAAALASHPTPDEGEGFPHEAAYLAMGEDPELPRKSCGDGRERAVSSIARELLGMRIGTTREGRGWLPDSQSTRELLDRLDAALDASPTPDGEPCDCVAWSDPDWPGCPTHGYDGPSPYPTDAPASPVLGDEERERLKAERDEERATREVVQVEVHKLKGKLAQGEERDG